MQTLRNAKKQLLDLLPTEGETPEECWEALDDFVSALFEEEGVTWDELNEFQENTKNYVINDIYNDIVTICEMTGQWSRYDLNLALDRFDDIIALYAAASQSKKKESK